jgi:hypothetical protein
VAGALTIYSISGKNKLLSVWNEITILGLLTKLISASFMVVAKCHIWLHTHMPLRHTTAERIDVSNKAGFFQNIYETTFRIKFILYI